VAEERGLLAFADRRAWRAWPRANHRRAAEAWLVLYKRAARPDSLSIGEAQEEALCFGWIDHLARGLDSSRFTLRFTPRRPGSIWSMTNIRRVERLTREGRMAAAGLARVAAARENGQWQAAIDRERTDLIPPELRKALRGRKGALAGYRGLPDSRKKQLLHWLLTARSAATRQRRLEATVREAARRAVQG